MPLLNSFKNDSKRSLKDCLRLILFIFINHYTWYLSDFWFELTFNPYNRPIDIDKPLSIIFDGIEGICSWIFYFQFLIYFPGFFDLIILNILFYKTYIPNGYFIIHCIILFFSHYLYFTKGLGWPNDVQIYLFTAYLFEFLIFTYFKNKSYRQKLQIQFDNESQANPWT